SATLQACSPRSLRLDPTTRDPLAYHMAMLGKVAAEHPSFDVLHFHIDYLHFPASKAIGWPHLTTLHGRLDLPELQPVYDQFGDMPVVSISNAQRAPLPQAGWLATVHHGLPQNLLAFSPRPADHFAFIGRVSPEKRVDRAIEIARRLKAPLRIAAKVDAADRAYHEETIAPLLRSSSHVEFIGEIGEDAKSSFLGGARALLFPIDWPEPFGLVMIEAMACGTPVIAFRKGSVPEVIDHGVTGFIVDTMDEAVDAAARAPELSRWRIREQFERRFTARHMANNYLRLYRQLAARNRRAA
ncbi:MAG TPA: glycosyltransferase family 4 protein, partial [Polyangia bacterium]